jgi:hypothetical protein
MVLRPSGLGIRRQPEGVGPYTAETRPAQVMRDTEITAPDVTVFLDMLEGLDRQRKDLASQLERAQAEARSRDADNLGEVKSLVTLLDGAEGRRGRRCGYAFGPPCGV